MSYRTLMVYLTLGAPHEDLLELVADLAQRHAARVIGITACQPGQFVYGDGLIAPEVIEQDAKKIENDIGTAKERFFQLLQNRVPDLAWRAERTLEPTAQYLADEARAADLIIAQADSHGLLVDLSRSTDMADVVMRSGRPVLIVPPDVARLAVDHALIAWTETPEARRAVRDAVPILQKAAQVTLATIAQKKEAEQERAHLEDVADWLKRHGIAADVLVDLSTGDDTMRLFTLAQERKVDVIVAGAYGHSRFREWVFGGVTRDLLLRPGICSLVSH